VRAAGLDIGSRTVKLVIVDDGELVLSRKALTSYSPLETALDLLKGVEYERMAATGYGRHLVADSAECDVISEIRAFAVGARALRPGCRTILDIGGQDTKAISLDEEGHTRQFEMNDKCAAGTGRFLEVMAAALGFSLGEFSEAAQAAEQEIPINATCAVFAESEVVSLIARGAARGEVARGVHKAATIRAVALLRRVEPTPEVFFAGGVALNPCAGDLLAEELGVAVFVPQDPQIVGALGAALHALGLERPAKQ
jgi:predicted CoA-substrate-specific enzyme activase